MKRGDTVIYNGSPATVRATRSGTYAHTSPERGAVKGQRYKHVRIATRAGLSSWVNVETVRKA